jgi:hypothetical protein
VSIRGHGSLSWIACVVYRESMNAYISEDMVQGGMDSDGNNVISSKGKMRMSDEERRTLAEKLDQDLDEFIGGLEKRSCTDEWPEDRWQEVRFRIPMLGNNIIYSYLYLFIYVIFPYLRL